MREARSTPRPRRGRPATSWRRHWRRPSAFGSKGDVLPVGSLQRQ